MPTLLLIEDNELNRDMLSRRLGKRGYTVLLAGNAMAGLELARRARPDLVLMDLSLPGVDGWAATRSLKADPVFARTPVIALTAHALEEDRERALAAGCDAFETKPVDLEALLHKIRSLLHAPTA